MEKNSSHRVAHQEKSIPVTVESKKLETTDQLPPPLQALLAMAKAKYNSVMPDAQTFDDSQEKFSSKMAHFVEGCDWTSKAALKTVHTGENQ